MHCCKFWHSILKVLLLILTFESIIQRTYDEKLDISRRPSYSPIKRKFDKNFENLENTLENVFLNDVNPLPTKSKPKLHIPKANIRYFITKGFHLFSYSTVKQNIWKVKIWKRILNLGKRSSSKDSNPRAKQSQRNTDQHSKKF